MGTSNSNPGQKGSTPLVPSWLEDGNIGNDQNLQDKPIPPIADNDRFRVPRGDFTRYVNSSGRSSGNLHRAVSGYVNSSLGGPKNAVMRLGAARASSERLISILNGISRSSLNSTLVEHGLGELIGKTTNEILWGLIDYVCPDGGSTDEGIARSSFIETISTLKELGITDITQMNEEQFLALTESYFSNVIMGRLINDIGNKAISLPDNIETVEVIENQIGSFIRGAVSDAIANLNVKISDIAPSESRRIVENIYETSYKILGAIYDGGKQ